MSYEQVASIVPKRFVKSARVWSTWVPKGAFLSQTNAQVSSRMYIVSIVTPLTADEVANIYFDKEGFVIGGYYSSNGGNRYWKPKWMKSDKLDNNSRH